MVGQCDGTYLDELAVNEHSECYQACQQNIDCLWYTYDRAYDLCLLYQNCPILDQRCETCISSQSLCVPTEYSKVMVIGGFNEEVTYLKDVDVLDLATSDNNCDHVRDLPISVYGNDATYYNGQVLACGGFNSDYQDDCFIYNPQSNSWDQMESMMSTRIYHRSSVIQDVWFISGGQHLHSGINSELDSTEVWDGSSFAPGPELPETMQYHCQVTINDTHVFVSDIDLLYGSSGGTYLLNWEDKTWAQLETLRNLKDRPACGLARSESKGVEIVVVGDGESEIFSLESMSWRSGPDQSFPTSVLTAAQLRKTFLVVGGSAGDSNETVRKVYEYDPEEETFVLLEQELEVSRSEAAAVAIPENSIVNCQ